MAINHANTTSPSAPISYADASRALAVLRQFIFSAGGPTSGDGELQVARLISGESSDHSTAVPSPSLTKNMTTRATSGPLAPPPDSVSVNTGRAPTDVHSPMYVPLVNTLQHPPLSPSHSPSPSPPAFPLTPAASAVRARIDSELEEIHNPLRFSTFFPDNAPSSIPLDSPLAGRARLNDPRRHVRVKTYCEWRIFAPDWHLEYVFRDSKEGGSVVYPPAPCTACAETKTICSGVIGIKCAHCKAKHTRCSLYEHTPEGRACAKALIAGKAPVEGRAPVPATPPAVEADPFSKRATHPGKKVRLDSPSLSPCFSHPNEAVSTAALTSHPSSPDPPINFALIIRSMLVAAIDALDKSLEEQGVSKVLGKRHSRD